MLDACMYFGYIFADYGEWSFLVTNHGDCISEIGHMFITYRISKLYHVLVTRLRLVDSGWLRGKERVEERYVEFMT